MNVEIIGAESLGVRGLCCFVETKDRKILIDPGVALGYVRHKLLPHPIQIAIDEKVQKRIMDVWNEATDIVLSHFHGDLG
jgi:predicted metallo-beta-lactamase superfamily hydrolase